MPENEWIFYHRNTKIVTGDFTISYPFEANIWQFPLDKQLDYLESVAKANMTRGEKPEQFIDWVYWKFGDKIALEYMIPYNMKIWSCDLDTLGTYWLEKLPDVSFRDILASCLSHKPYGTLPGHAQFYYPKHAGYGEVFLRMADFIKENIRYEYTADDLDIRATTVNNDFTGTYIINTAPWHEFVKSLPEEFQVMIDMLQYTSIDVDYFPDKSDTDAHWTYYADTSISYHRQIHRDNIIAGSKGYWTETNARRRAPLPPGVHFENIYAYPLNTLNKPQIISNLLSKMKKYNILGLGRWGEWEHYNSDVVMERGIRLAEQSLRWQ
jgi:protoporphyrinogen oxidase